MNRKILVILGICVIAAMGVVAYYLAIRKQPTQEIIATPTSSPASTTQSSNPPPSQPPLATSSLTKLDISRVAVSGMGNNPSHYKWNDVELTFGLDSNRAILTVVRNGATLINNERVWNYSNVVVQIVTFLYQNSQYFLMEGNACGNRCGKHELSLYRLDGKGNFARMGSGPFFSTDNNLDVEEVFADQNGKVYIIIGYGNSRTAIVLGPHGNYETSVTGGYQQGAKPSGVVPPKIEELLQLPRG